MFEIAQQTRGRVALLLSLLAGLAGVSVLAGPLGAADAAAPPSVAAEPPNLESPGGSAAVTEQCLLTGSRQAHSLTVVGQMLATSATARMRIKLELQERGTPAEHFRTVEGPGLGVWNLANPGVSEYRDIRQVTNLAAFGSYRVQMTFLWLDSSGNVLKQQIKLTPVCSLEASA